MLSVTRFALYNVVAVSVTVAAESICQFGFQFRYGTETKIVVSVVHLGTNMIRQFHELFSLIFGGFFPFGLTRSTLLLIDPIPPCLWTRPTDSYYIVSPGLSKVILTTAVRICQQKGEQVIIY